MARCGKRNGSAGLRATAEKRVNATVKDVSGQQCPPAALQARPT